MKDCIFLLVVTFYTLVVSGQQKMQNFQNVSIATEKNVDQHTEEYYLKEIKSNPESPVVYYNMGLYYSIKYQFDYAEAQYNKALQLDSTFALAYTCLLYTSDAADERSSVDLGGRRIIKKKKDSNITHRTLPTKYKT